MGSARLFPQRALHDIDEEEGLIAEAVANNTLLAGSAGMPG